MINDSSYSEAGSAQQCAEPRFKIYAFSEEAMRDIASNFASTSYRALSNPEDFWHSWDFKNSYADDNTIKYWVDPTLPEYLRTAIYQGIANQSTLTKITFEEQLEKSDATELSFEAFTEKDKEHLSNTAATTGKNSIKFDLEDVNENNASYYVNHEMVHFLGVSHVGLSNDQRFRELGLFFQSSIVTNSKPLEQMPWVIAPLDVYALEEQMKYEPSLLEQWLGGKTTSYNNLNYRNYYDRLSTDSNKYISDPQVFIDSNGSKTMQIVLGDWVVDREVAIFEMPSHNDDGSKDIAIMSSAGFTIIKGVVDGKYDKLEIAIEPQNLQMSGASVFVPSGQNNLIDNRFVAKTSLDLSGTITLDSIKSALSNSLENNVYPDFYNIVADGRVQSDSGPIQSLNYCNVAGNLEEANDVASNNIPKPQSNLNGQDKS